jgi:hypothetical protein
MSSVYAVRSTTGMLKKDSILQAKKMHDKSFLFKQKPVSYKIQSKEFLKIAI